MKFLLKSSPHDWKTIIKVAEKLENQGVKVCGFEIHALENSTPEKVFEAVDGFRAHGFEVVGFHPPFPTYYREVVAWANVVNRLGMEYVVYHAGSSRGICSLGNEARKAKEVVHVPLLFENLPYGHPSKLYSPVSVALLGDVLIDIPHLRWSWRQGKLEEPWKVVERVQECIGGVHVAEPEPHGKDGLPIEKGSKFLRKMLNFFFQKLPDVYYIGEPAQGHLHGGRGHYTNALGFWNLWLEFRDNGSLI